MMIFIRNFLIFCLALLASMSLCATIPTHIKDVRIKTVRYDPNEVVLFKVQPGRGAVIEFAPNEKIIFVTNGYAGEWEIAQKNNMLYLGAKSVNATTNLIVQTDQRQYFIDLVVVRNNGSYKLKYTYGPSYPHYYPKDKKYNYAYYGFGDRELAPLAVYDDGYMTFFQFRHQQDAPSIYKIMPDGSEAIVNFHVEDDKIIVHEISKRFNIRLGKKVLGIVNKGKFTQGYNHSKTSDDTMRKIRR